MSKPSTNFDNLWRQAGVNVGDEKVIKKFQAVKSASRKRTRSVTCLKEITVTVVFSSLLTWCVYELLKRGEWKVLRRIEYALFYSTGDEAARASAS